MNITQKYIAGAAASAMIASLAMTSFAFAQDNQQQNGGENSGQNRQSSSMGMMERDGIGNDGMRRPDVVGKVTAINGTTLTVVGGIGMNRPILRQEERGDRDGKKNASSTRPVPPVIATTTYSVDASTAIVIKNKATTTLSSVVVGDFVAIQGTVAGTNVTAKTIRYGIMIPRGDKVKDKLEDILQGNGQPIIGGTVISISGSVFTLTNTSSTTYSVDASNAVIRKGMATSTVSAIAVNDHVTVQGAINGTSVVASTVIDQPAKVAGENGGDRGGVRIGVGAGFFGSIGGFFKHLFGF